MKNIIITGASGMIGGLILESCLSDPQVGQVTSIARKPSGKQHPKLVEVIHTDFLDYTPVQAYLQNQDICFYCIGVYTGQVPSVEFNRITIDYTLAFAKALRVGNNNLNFCFLSGQGADSTEKSRILFAKSKGIAENGLLKLGFAHTYILRPGYIYPVTPRKEPNWTYGLMRTLWRPISAVYPNFGVASTQLAAKMIEIGMSDSSQCVYENKDIRI